jgi:hypothetical protein
MKRLCYEGGMATVVRRRLKTQEYDAGRRLRETALRN